jgi:flagellar motor switch protein FliG
LTGKQKAAMLLMSLDAGTASELLEGIDAKTVQELAVELANLNATGYESGHQSVTLARQFCDSLNSNAGFHLEGFLKEMLRSTVGEGKSRQIQGQIRELLQKDGPFARIGSVDSVTIASVIKDEHPQAAAVVLSEIPAEKNPEVLGFLGEGIRVSVAARMSSCDTVPEETKAEIAERVCRRLDHIEGVTKEDGASTRVKQLSRQVALSLRGLDRELRDGLLRAVAEEDGQVCQEVAGLMIVWEDIAQISDGSLQEALKETGVRQLALALSNADHSIIEKVRTNISQAVFAALKDESSAVSNPQAKDIEEAREEIVSILREMHEVGEVIFMEEQSNAGNAQNKPC